MTDETPDLRWLGERVDRNHAETSADIARLETAIAAIPAAMEKYVLQRVYDADERRRQTERDADDRRFLALEDGAKTKTASGKAWILGLGLAAAGAAFAWLAQLLQAKGGH